MWLFCQWDTRPALAAALCGAIIIFLTKAKSSRYVVVCLALRAKMDAIKLRNGSGFGKAFRTSVPCHPHKLACVTGNSLSLTEIVIRCNRWAKFLVINLLINGYENRYFDTSFCKCIKRPLAIKWTKKFRRPLVIEIVRNVDRTYDVILFTSAYDWFRTKLLETDAN